MLNVAATWKPVNYMNTAAMTAGQWTRNLITGMITFSHSIGKKMKHRYQSFTRIGRQFQSLERQVYADWTSVSFPSAKGVALYGEQWRIHWRIQWRILMSWFFCRFQFLVEVIVPDIRISSSLFLVKALCFRKAKMAANVVNSFSTFFPSYLLFFKEYIEN